MSTSSHSFVRQLMGLFLGAPIVRNLSKAAAPAKVGFRPLHPIGRGKASHTNTSQRSRANRRKAKRAARVHSRRGN